MHLLPEVLILTDELAKKVSIETYIFHHIITLVAQYPICV